MSILPRCHSFQMRRLETHCTILSNSSWMLCCSRRSRWEGHQAARAIPVLRRILAARVTGLEILNRQVEWLREWLKTVISPPAPTISLVQVAEIPPWLARTLSQSLKPQLLQQLRTQYFPTTLRTFQECILHSCLLWRVNKRMRFILWYWTLMKHLFITLSTAKTASSLWDLAALPLLSLWPNTTK